MDSCVTGHGKAKAMFQAPELQAHADYYDIDAPIQKLGRCSRSIMMRQTL